VRLFVHMAYGNPTVYSAETERDLRIIYNAMADILEDFGEKPNRPDLITPVTERMIVNLIDSFGIGEHESFEYGTEFTNLIKR
jgi:hypothetical protein